MSNSFPEWVAAVVDHPVGSPEWYWADDFDALWAEQTVSPLLTVEYLTRLLRETDCLNAYSLDQVAQSIWFLIGESSPAQVAYLLVEPGVPLERRLDCIIAMAEFFRTFVARAAPGASNHHSDPFHIAVYMWWDIFPYRFGPEAAGGEVGACCLSVMRSTLRLPSELCQINALHGLNHWQPYYPREVSEAIEHFVAEGASLSPTVREYVQAAWGGNAS